MKRIIHSALLSLVCAVCVVPLSAQPRTTPKEYIERYKHHAVADHHDYGIPASVKMAQALLESDSGNSRLAVQANNHFGIKCKSDWTGATIRHDDDALQECFRKYPSAEDSFRDHAEFLKNSPRYARLFLLDNTDYKAWARGLKECGYATNPRYAELLIDLIERHELYRLDGEEPPMAGAKTVHREPDIAPVLAGLVEEFNNGTKCVVARSGDTYESIGRETGVGPAKLRRFNDAGKGHGPAAGEFVYLAKKAARSVNGRVVHTVAAGETLRGVSQRYGIRLRSLARLNRMSPTQSLTVGQQVRLM